MLVYWLGYCDGKYGATTVERVAVVGGSVSGYLKLGFICGFADRGCTFRNCYVKDTIMNLNNAWDGSGGLWSDRSDGNAYAYYCYNSATYQRTSSGTWYGKPICKDATSITSCYYDTLKKPSYMPAQGGGISNFGSMASLPSGFSSDTWQIVKGWPELKVFIK